MLLVAGGDPKLRGSGGGRVLPPLPAAVLPPLLPLPLLLPLLLPLPPPPPLLLPLPGPGSWSTMATGGAIGILTASAVSQAELPGCGGRGDALPGMLGGVPETGVAAVPLAAWPRLDSWTGSAPAVRSFQ